MTRPVIGITACNRLIGAETAQTVMNRYVDAAMRYGDVAALLIPALPDLMDASEIIGRLDAVLLTGSPSNLAGYRYGADEGYGPFDEGRDGAALGVIEQMIAAGKPVFGICRGFQEINVALGGTLRRDVSSPEAPLPHHAPEEVAFDAMFAHGHSVELRPDGMLARAFGSTTARVNSVHYQGIDRLAEGLTVEALAPDGLVEAYSARPNGAPVLGVQWHPEWHSERNLQSQAYFRLLGEAARGTL